MANAFKNTDFVLKLAIAAFENNLQLASKIDRQLDETQTFSGDTGATVRLRRPVYFTSTPGAELTSGQITDIEEATVPFTLNQRRKVAFSISNHC